MICTAMSELQLVSLAAECVAEDLVAEADAENGGLADKAADLAGLRGEHTGIARAVGQEHTIGFEREYVVRAGSRGHHGHARANLDQTAQDVALDSEIVSHHVAARLGGGSNEIRGRARNHGLVPLIAGGRAHASSEIESLHGWNGASAFH